MYGSSVDYGMDVCELNKKDREKYALSVGNEGNGVRATTCLLYTSGGRGGRGNTAFKTQTNTAPDYSENGDEGEKKNLKVEVKKMCIRDRC